MAATEPTDSAKVFMAGKSQAVRLPKKFRFPDGCDEVTIRQIGGALILTPRYKTWDELFANMEPVDDDFVDAVLAAKQEDLGEDSRRASFDG
ncbi:MAG: type II toxin-antitoxin system VapB family antitoxin [Pseudomonadota bacterium]